MATREECHWSHSCSSFEQASRRGNQWHPPVQTPVGQRAPYPDAANSIAVLNTSPILREVLNDSAFLRIKSAGSGEYKLPSGIPTSTTRPPIRVARAASRIPSTELVASITRSHPRPSVASTTLLTSAAVDLAPHLVAADCLYAFSVAWRHQRGDRVHGWQVGGCLQVARL